MKLNHLDLQVRDVTATISFFERYFGLECTSNRSSPAIAFMSDGDGFVLVLQRTTRPEDAYPEGFHLGFLVDDPAIVRRFHARATEGGLEVSDLIQNNRGDMVYCRAPDGFMVEVSCRRQH